MKRLATQLALWTELLRLCRRRAPALYYLTFAALALDTCAIGVAGLSLRGVVNATLTDSRAGVLLWATVAAFAYTMTLTVGELAITLRVRLVEEVANEEIETDVRRMAMSIDTIDHLERPEYLDRLGIVRNNAWAVVDSAWSAAESVFLTARVVFTLALLGSVDPLLLLVLGAAAIPVFFGQRGRIRVQRANLAAAEGHRLQQHLFDVITSPASGKEVRVSGVGPELVRRQRQITDESDRLRLRAQCVGAAWEALGWTLFIICFMAGVARIASSAGSSPSAIGNLLLAVTVGMQLRSIIEHAVRRSTDANKQGPVLDSYRWLREYKASQRGDQGARRPPPALREGILFEDVSFVYPGTKGVALEPLSVSLPAGAVVAIVGEYGSGKTTITKLLSKMYHPTGGRILVDGVDLAQIDTYAWRSRMSAAFQDFGRYSTSFADAATIGDYGAADATDRLPGAVREAGASGLVTSLPDGPLTQLGQRFGGVELSEGQWQQLALTRSFMRTQPLVLVLDEPTASLDAPSEHAVFQRCMDRARSVGRSTGAITVLVSHRFSTVVGADLILVMHKGRLVEAGTHDELIKPAAGQPSRDRHYRDLYDLQAAAYRT
jgi:ABC-type multidrug transport system fused ATPase/permease subunit